MAKAPELQPGVSLQLSDDNFWGQDYLKQKGLIQAHIGIGNELWAIIQASQFNLSRPWTRFDRSLINLVVDRITPLVSVYAKRELRQTVQHIHDGYR